MGGKRNRNAGNQCERDEIKILKEIGFTEAVSSRAESRTRDDLKVDLCNTGVLNIQVKTAVQSPNYIELLNQMPDEPDQLNMVAFQKTKKSAQGKFMKKGKYYIMDADSLYHLLRLTAKYCPEEIGIK